MEEDERGATLNLWVGRHDFECDQYTSARKFEERALEVMRRVLGEEHPDTLISMNNLAHTWVVLGQSVRARKLVVPAVASARKVWGEEHPKTKALATFLERLESGLSES